MADDTSPEPAQNSAVERPRGRPFPKGKSGNPGGRPKGAIEFRQRCRALATRLLDDIEADLDSMTPGQRLYALEVLADRGGYLSGEKLAAAEASRGRLMLEALAIQALGADERKALLARWQAHEAEAMGADVVQ